MDTKILNVNRNTSFVKHLQWLQYLECWASKSWKLWKQKVVHLVLNAIVDTLHQDHTIFILGCSTDMLFVCAHQLVIVMTGELGQVFDLTLGVLTVIAWWYSGVNYCCLHNGYFFNTGKYNWNILFQQIPDAENSKNILNTKMAGAGIWIQIYLNTKYFWVQEINDKQICWIEYQDFR